MHVCVHVSLPGRTHLRDGPSGYDVQMDALNAMRSLTLHQRIITDGFDHPSTIHPSIHTAYSIHSWKQKNQNAQRAESHLEQSRPLSAKPHVERAEQEQDTSHENGIAERDYDALPCLEQQVHAAREQCSPH